MSIYATNFIMDQETGLPKLVKHLNQKRVDRYSWDFPGGWNKSGNKARHNKVSKRKVCKERRFWKQECKVTENT
jgi:hypothetical protein